MLVLGRKQNEAILIGPVGGQIIRISVVDIRPTMTRIGIDCDRSIVIRREEIKKQRMEKS